MFFIFLVSFCPRGKDGWGGYYSLVPEISLLLLYLFLCLCVCLNENSHWCNVRPDLPDLLQLSFNDITNDNKANINQRPHCKDSAIMQVCTAQHQDD